MASPPDRLGPAAMAVAAAAAHSDTASASAPPLAQQSPAHHLRDIHHHHQDHQHPPDQTNHHYRSQTLDHAANSSPTSPASPSSPPIKRKPLSSTASPLATRFSHASSRTSTHHSYSHSRPPSHVHLPAPDHRFSRSCSVDSPTLYEYPAHSAHPIQAAQPKNQTPVAELASPIAAASGSRNIPGRSPADSQTDFSDVLSEYGDQYDDLISELAPDYDHDDPVGSVIEDRADDAASTYSETIHPNPSPPMFASKPTPPHLNLQTSDTSLQPDTRQGSPSDNPQLDKPLPKSPGQPSPFASLFGWGNPSPSVTEFSSIPSPLSPARNGRSNDAQHTKPNAATSNPLGYIESYLTTPPPSTSATLVQIEEMEDELKAISGELAGSIRREMDLEELVDRLQEQANNPQAPGKRTSDYFSDSGYSSAKHSEYDQGREEVEKIQRRSEQEKASLRLELTNKLQDERSRTKALDQQIKELAEKASQMDLASINNMDANGRLKDLEDTCEDLRRKLSEERKSKNNFEDLLGALRSELEDTCNERDNLRDEIVPQLRARVEGLETEAAEYSNLTYESTKMQQELQTLKQENSTLRKSGMDDLPGTRASRAMSGGLSRSNSVATGSLRNQRAPALGLSRSNSVKSGQLESREALAERLKDVEAQRDALHNALKNLLERQEFQNRENQKRIRVLENDRQRILSGSPRKAGFEKDISNLRTEINLLRRRAEDALEQKWQVEKGLGGLKMDLDRAEEEIAALRSLLKEKDILIPPSLARSSGSSSSSSNLGAPVTSESLQNAYKELQTAYAESLERIKKMELGAGLVGSDEKTQLAIQRLELSLSAAMSERDAARHQAASLKSQYDGLAASESKNVSTELALADELSESAHQVEQLASQVRQQLSTNTELRQRLSDTVVRGDMDRKANSDRITGLMERLRILEDQLVAAQSASEDRVTRHEDEISKLREAHNEQLRRMDSSSGLGGLRSPGLKSPRNPLLNAGASPFASRSPRISPAKNFEDETEMKLLRAKVAELEKALADAESEMQVVVAKMSAAQIEVMNLQEERETAARDTRKLQKMLEKEQVNAFEGRFKTLTGNA